MLFKKQNSKIQKQTHTHTHTHKGSGSDFQCCFHDILRHTKPWSKKIEINLLTHRSGSIDVSCGHIRVCRRKNQAHGKL